MPPGAQRAGAVVTRRRTTTDPSRIGVPADGDGKVTFIDNAVDPTTGTIKLKATFPNNDRALWPGLFVQVALQLSTAVQRASSCRPSAVQASQHGQYVYVVKPDRTVEHADRHGRPAAGRRDGDRARPRRGRGSRHGRSAAADAGARVTDRRGGMPATGRRDRAGRRGIAANAMGAQRSRHAS